MRGEGRQSGGALIHLLVRGEFGQRQCTVWRRRSEVQGGDAAQPEEGDDLGRWAKWAGLAEWAGLAAGLAKGFGPKSRI
jgi:hypothetical protein